MSTQKILLVEDTPTQAAHLSYILEENGYDVDIASSAKQALEKIKTNLPDMVISDILMPEMDGFEFCKIFKAKHPEIPFMILTQLSSSDDIIKGLNSNADNFVIKLAEPGFIIPRVKELFDNFKLNQDKIALDSSDLEIILQDNKYTINANNQQTLNLLISTFESAIEQNKELKKYQIDLQFANDELEKRSEELSQSETKYKALAESLELEVYDRTEELKIEKDRFQSVSMIAPALICILKGSEHTIEFANPLFNRLFGDRQLAGLTYREALPELEGQGFFEELDKVYQTTIPFIANEALAVIDKLNNGVLSNCYFNFIYHATFDKNNQVNGITIFAVEVTEQVIARKEVEKLNQGLVLSEGKYKALAESLEIKVQERTKDLLEANKKIEYERSKLNKLLMNIPALICLSEGPNHIYKFINPAYQKIVGDRNYISKGIEEVLPELVGQGFFDLLDNVYTTGQTYIGNETPVLLDRDGDGKLSESYMNFVYQPILDINGQVEGISTFAFDVSEQVLARQQLDNLYKEVQRSNNELQNFASMASHDLQAPLRTISSFVQLLFKNSKERFDADEVELMNFIKEGVQRMQELINSLLDYSKIGIEKKDYTNSDLNEIVQTVLSDLQPVIDENQAIINYNNLPTVSVDKGQIIRLFQNLISNAIKYRSDNQPIINILSKKEDKNYLFSISDNGIGIEEVYYDKVFDIFQRLEIDKNVKGTGIGLANCKKIIEQHNGKIWIESVEGQGSTFYFTVPA